MKISELIALLEQRKEECGDIGVVVNKYHYTPITEVIPIFEQETLEVTSQAFKYVEIY